MPECPAIRVAEMFAGVGGFRLALDGYHDSEHPEFDMDSAGPFKTIWANQWEPPGTERKQFAWRCYEKRFGKGSCINEDINAYLDKYENEEGAIPDFDMLVGGFPCQDYSVAKPLSLAGGIEGKKGILWWDIYRMLVIKKPKYLLLENVDRLIKSPAGQRGRDFAIMLNCLAEQGYSIEWRIINAADYGMPQKRRRVYIFGVKTRETWNLEDRLLRSGVIPSAFPVKSANIAAMQKLEIKGDPFEISEHFGKGEKKSAFQNAGVMQDYMVLTQKVAADYDGPFTTLGDIVVDDSEVPEEFFIPDDKLPIWKTLRAAKKLERTTKEGFTYMYSEGSMAFPDALDKPARTILTGEGGSGASRMKHAIKGSSNRIRRLVPDELDQLQMFPKGWTNTGMTDGNRAFCMGNALVVGIPHKLGRQIAKLEKS